MFIKQVVIENFKSYGERIVLEPFDQRHNVVVGPNGAGKSNLFCAIQFVLSDEFTYVKTKQRKSWLHDGPDLRAQSGFVEIIFDNSNRRFPIAEDEVFVRRHFTEIKDEYYLNKRITPRSQVMAALESAGFTPRNPYYIVQQGKVTELATSRDRDLLKLLKKSAGMELHEKKYTICSDLLNVITTNIGKIDNLLKDFKERLDVLEQEQEDLRQYQKYDKLHSTIELLIAESDLERTTRSLVDLEMSRNQASHRQVPLQQNMQSTQDDIKRSVRLMKETKMELASLQEERDIYNDNYQRLIKEKEKFNLTVTDLAGELENDAKAKNKAEGELACLTSKIQKREAELEKVNRQYKLAKQQQDNNYREIVLKEQECKNLYGKLNRGNQFPSKEERDIWIRNELELLSKQIRDKCEHVDALTIDINITNEKKDRLVLNREEWARKLEENRACIEDCNKQCRELDKNKEQQQCIRNESWREENMVQRNLLFMKEELATENQRLISKAGRSVVNGCESVVKVLVTLKEHGGYNDILKGYHGIVMDNFECDKNVYTAVEVVSGNRLLYHIVDSDQVATRILNEMTRMKLKGEVNFLPMNRLNVKDITYQDNEHAIPMVEKLTYQSKYDRVFRFLFGRKLICRNFDVATEMARSTGFECVTVEGDKVAPTGALSGGYIDTSKLRLEIHRARTVLSQKIDDTTEGVMNLKKKLETVDSKINKIEYEIQANKSKIVQVQGNSDILDGKMKASESTMLGYDDLLKKRSTVALKADLQVLEATKQSLILELDQDLLSQLSTAEKAKLKTVTEDIRNLQKSNNIYSDEVIKAEQTINKLDNVCNILCKKRQQLLNFLKEISFGKREKQLGTFHTELGEVDEKMEYVESNLVRMDVTILDASENLKKYREELEKYTNTKQELQSEIDKHAQILDTFVPKLALLERKLTELTLKIDGIGAVPSHDMYQQYARLSHSSLMKEKSEVKKKLNKYNYVNKKAIVQIEDYSTEVISFVKGKKYLDLCLKVVQNLLLLLHACKSYTMSKAFTQISKNFTEVFKKLVPGGKASMVIISADAVEYKSLPLNVNIDNFTGVSLKVSFHQKEHEMVEMLQLSGGQKSLVALGLIFAIQKFNPAPFYLFDEIDQALDKEYRQGLASLIHELSDSNQFITTTFRPELLRYANKFYAVTFGNQNSQVHCVEKNAAINFVGQADDFRY